MTAQRTGCWRDGTILVALGLVLVIGGRIAAPGTAAARDLDGRYANSPLKQWFDSLHSGKGPCCSDADGTALSDVDWEARDGHYRVRIEGQWWDVPDEAVIKSRTGLDGPWCGPSIITRPIIRCAWKFAASSQGR